MFVAARLRIRWCLRGSGARTGYAVKGPLILPWTLDQAEKLGSEGCAEIDARLPDGKRDTTHLGPKGRQEIGRMAAQEFVRLIPAMRDFAADPVRP